MRELDLARDLSFQDITFVFVNASAPNRNSSSTSINIPERINNPTARSEWGLYPTENSLSRCS
jgi:hypothetical protein